MPYRAATNNLWKSSPHRDLLHFDFSHQRCSCRRANSLLACHAVRPKRFFAALVPGFLLATHSYAQPTQLMIERNSGPARLGVIGEANHDYVLEVSAGDISSNGWQPLITATLTNSPLMWFDSASALMPQRFYRAVKLTDPASAVVAPDFRLIDHLGRSRELKYHLADTNVRSIVLISPATAAAKSWKWSRPSNRCATSSVLKASCSGWWTPTPRTTPPTSSPKPTRGGLTCPSCTTRRKWWLASMAPRARSRRLH